MDNNDELIAFLQTDPLSFEIENFTIKNSHINDFKTVMMDMAQPQYFENEDRVVSSIRLHEEQRIPSFYPKCRVTFQNNMPANVSTSYYALGYPGCDHYDTEDQIEFIQEARLAPLFITHAIHADEHLVTFENGLITHRAPTAAGMSGGPLFYFPNTTTLTIFGVITSGADDDENGCD